MHVFNPFKVQSSEIAPALGKIGLGKQYLSAVNMNSRIDLALDFLKEGQPFTIGDLRLEIEDDKRLIVIGWSQYLNFENLRKEAFLKELTNVKSIFGNILEVSKKMKSFIADKLIEFKLCYDDGGKASINICSEESGIVTWIIDIK